MNSIFNFNHYSLKVLNFLLELKTIYHNFHRLCHPLKMEEISGSSFIKKNFLAMFPKMILQGQFKLLFTLVLEIITGEELLCLN